ncbi:MAG: N-acetylmuramoyl-L-alanine amidase [Bacillota bacterium]
MKLSVLKILLLILTALVTAAGILLLSPDSGAEQQHLDIAVPGTASPYPAQDTPEGVVTSAGPAGSPEPSLSPGAQASPSPTPKPAPTITPAPASSPKPSPTEKPQEKPLAGVIVGVDPGHQAHSNSDPEPIAPGSSEMKAKVSSGTYGRFTGVREHEVNLKVGLLLRDLLKDAGATVVMTRTTADVDISNAERAELFNKKKVDLGIRIHCNGSDDPSVAGAFMLVPTENPYKDDCVAAAKLVLAEYGKATGISVRKGLTYRSDQTGFNWCERPVINIEMGHMTNKEEDYKLTDADFQKKMAKGIYNGILRYFEDKGG